MLKPTIDQTAIRGLMKELRQVDPDLAKALGKETKTALMPIANRIQPWIPNTSPLSGMNHNGRTRYTQAKVKVSVTPGAGWGKAFAAFTAEGASSANAAAKIVEFAGTKGSYSSGQSREYTKNGKTVRHRLNGQGSAMVRGLESSPRAMHPRKEGRYFFQGYKANKAGMLNMVQGIIDNFIEAANERLT